MTTEDEDERLWLAELAEEVKVRLEEEAVPIEDDDERGNASERILREAKEARRPV